MADDKKNPKEASNIFHSIMKASVKPVTNFSDKKDRFYKEIDAIQSYHKSELSSELSEYFTVPQYGDTELHWAKQPPKTVKEKVSAAFIKFLS